MTVTEETDNFIAENGGNERDALIVPNVKAMCRMRHEYRHHSEYYMLDGLLTTKIK